MIAIDLTLIPYHGQPAEDESEICRSAPKSGTTHFHAYATAVVVHKGHRFTLALTRVVHGEPMKDVVQRLVRIVRKRHIKIKILLLDKGFFSVSVISYLNRAGHGFIIPAVPRGRKPKPPKKATGLRALLKKNHGFYQHTLTSNADGGNRSTRVTICVASKKYKHKKSDTRRSKKILFAVRGIRLAPKHVREAYRKRFGIETSYRQMNEAHIKTSTRNPAHRLLFAGVALILRNVWVWLHFKFAKGKWAPEPQLFLKLLRFKEMLLWITQVVQRLLRADQIPGIDLETYQRVTVST
jgi:putative transposase